MDRYVAFREFVAHRRSALSRTAYLLTGDRDDAEDLLQAALTKTLGRWGKVDVTDNPEGYVRQVMLNDVRSRWRRRSRGSEHPIGLALEGGESDDIAAEVTQRDSMLRASDDHFGIGVDGFITFVRDGCRYSVIFPALSEHPDSDAEPIRPGRVPTDTLVEYAARL